MIRLFLILLILPLLVWRVKKGFQNGILEEIVNIISMIISIICIVLVFFTISSIKAKAFSVLTICIVGLIVIGITFKLCSLIFRPILAIKNISIIGSFDKLLGAMLGVFEVCICICAVYWILRRLGIYIF